MRIKNRDLLVKILSAIGDLPRGLLFEHTATGNPATFNTNVAKPMELTAGMNPVQDLHGYEYPWPGGAGKNLLKNTAESSTQTSGITYTVYEDGTVLATGTASSESNFTLAYPWKTVGTFIINGCPSGGSTTSYRFQAYLSGSTVNDTGSGATFTVTSDQQWRIRINIAEGTVLPTAGILFKPMIRLSTVTDDTFVPYENICPISGWDQTKITRAGEDIHNTATDVTGYYISASGTITASTNYSYSALIPVREGKTYRFSGVNSRSSSDSKRVHGYDASGTWVEQIDYVNAEASSAYYVDATITTGIKYIRISYRTDDTNVKVDERQTVTIPFTSTNYGGSITLNKDGSADVVVDKVFFELLGKTFTKSATGNGRFDFVPSTNNMPNTAGGDKFIICSHLKTVGSSDWSSTGAKVRINGSTKIFFQTGDAEMDTTEKLNTWLTAQNTAGTPVTACYEVAEPVTYTLTSEQIKTLLGTNNVWTNTNGTNTIKYMKRG